MSEVHVAVGVILDAQRNILLTRRATDAHQGGLWEFPGGKVEVDESVPQALARELREELGIEVTACQSLLEIRHDYGDKAVLLDVYIVSGFSGKPRGLEHQPMIWAAAAELVNFEFPAANVPIVKAVQAYLA